MPNNQNKLKSLFININPKTERNEEDDFYINHRQIFYEKNIKKTKAKTNQKKTNYNNRVKNNKDINSLFDKRININYNNINFVKYANAQKIKNLKKYGKKWIKIKV